MRILLLLYRCRSWLLLVRPKVVAARELVGVSVSLRREKEPTVAYPAFCEQSLD